ncbi:Muniscin C-terminal mu homology domain-containing protein [Xylariaceae sp. FL0594]|nr:Muniscin C-terminal mu homology domain-containing protein [Xylariaceae sp. FL0594]
MEGLSRAEYPGLLDSLQPSQAVVVLADRVKRINKLNHEIVEWLQERRKVEEQYAQGLRRLTQFRVPNAQSELGSFQPQWDKILQSLESIATSHNLFASHLEREVETPLRLFESRKETQNIMTMQGNLQKVARELDEAQDKSDKLSRKGGKASAQKVDMAVSKLESVQNQWRSQAPFVFENLQAVDESRMNLLRDCLTQYGTFEGEQAQRRQVDAENFLNSLLDYSTANEIQHFVSKVTAGRPKLEKRTTTARQSSSTAPSTSGVKPPSVHTPAEDDRSDYSGPREAPTENKLRSRIGTMLGRRRQSIHGGFGPLSPAKGPFGRGSKGGHGLSPMASSSNLGDSTNRLGSLAEDPDHSTYQPSRTSEVREKPSYDGTNGVHSMEAARPTTGATSASQANGARALAVSDVPPPPGPPPSQRDAEKDAEGFNVPPPSNDPISQAQREAAAQEPEQAFKLNIQKEPVAEEDEEAKKAALSNVANSLSAMGAPARRAGTVRGRRDVRNTIYVPSLVAENSAASPAARPAVQPPLPTTLSRLTGGSTLASDASFAATSDTQSVRSAASLNSVSPAKHPEMHQPGLNSSLIETVSAAFEQGVAKQVKVQGEIAFSYNPADDPNPPTHIPVRIINYSLLESIGPNRIFVSNNPDHSDQFTLDVSHMQSQRTNIGFTYKLHLDGSASSSERYCPILLQPTWKPQGDKLGLLLQYRLNPAFKFANAGGASVKVQLHNLVLFASYEGRASGAQTKPAGVHLKDKHIVYWRLGDLTLDPGHNGDGEEWQKIVCRVVGDQGSEIRPGSVEARWEVSLPPPSSSEGDSTEGVVSVARLVEAADSGKGKEVQQEEEEEDVDPFADADADADVGETQGQGKWVEVGVPLSRKVVSGKYEARPSP